MDLRNYRVAIPSDAPYHRVALPEAGNRVTYGDGKLTRSVKQWLTNNCGHRALTYELFQHESSGWIALEGYLKQIENSEFADMTLEQTQEWFVRNKMLFFYFKQPEHALLFKLTWGGA